MLATCTANVVRNALHCNAHLSASASLTTSDHAPTCAATQDCYWCGPYPDSPSPSPSPPSPSPSPSPPSPSPSPPGPSCGDGTIQEDEGEECEPPGTPGCSDGCMIQGAHAQCASLSMYRGSWPRLPVCLPVLTLRAVYGQIHAFCKLVCYVREVELSRSAWAASVCIVMIALHISLAGVPLSSTSAVGQVSTRSCICHSRHTADAWTLRTACASICTSRRYALMFRVPKLSGVPCVPHVRRRHRQPRERRRVRASRDRLV